MRYLSVGVLNTSVGLGVIYFGMYVLHLGDIAANGIGYVVGISLSFILNKHWTFSSRGAAAPQLVGFLLVTATAYFVNIASVLLLTDLVGLNHYLAQAFGVLPYTTVGYLGSRYFAFSTEHDLALTQRGSNGQRTVVNEDEY